MKKLVLVLCVIVIFGGCKKQFELQESKILISQLTKSDISVLANAAYDKSISSWILPKGDPYEVNSFNSILHSVTNDLDVHLLPTHHVLRVYPKNQEEQNILERNDSIKVSYHPLSYCLASKEESIWLDSHLERNTHSYSDTTKYSELIRIQNKDGSISEYYQSLPVLYVVWPIDKSIPDGLDYVIDYDSFIPAYSNQLNDSIIKKTEYEALRLSKWSDKFINDASRTITVASGSFYNNDNLLDSLLALEGLHIRFQLGSDIRDAATNYLGYFFIPVSIGSSAICIYNGNEWKITEMNSTTPIQVSLGNVTNNYPSNTVFYSNTIESSVHKAVSYYFSEDHPISIPSNNNILRIKLTRSYETWSGVFTAPLIGNPYIEISNNKQDYTGSMFAAVCHELGHYTHYYLKNNWLSYSTTHSLIKESYASYISWVISHSYYNFVGGIDNNFLNWDYFFCQDRQRWEKTYTNDNAYYSPIFVDLLDDSNQYYTIGINYNYDVIHDIPYSVITNIAVNSKNWNQLKSNLNGLVGTYITTNDYNSYIEPYNYYFNNN